MSDHNGLKITVTYPAARKPYQEDAPASETVGVLKTHVLAAFGLTEGTSEQGTTTYTLYHEQTPLEDLSQTLGSIAGHANALHLKLAQQITQG